jgi:hypothetical protein
MRWSSAAGAVLLVAIAGRTAGQTPRPCAEDRRGDRPHVCEIRELSLPARAALAVDAGPNGGVSVEAWDGPGIRVEARVDARATSEAGARRLASEIRIVTDGTIHAEGPASDEDASWSVGFHLRVPRHTDLSLDTHNGGIDVSGVGGSIRFSTVNGGVTLSALSGDVRGRTVNGGLDVALAGNSWQGAGLDVETTNGGVTLAVPAGYSAHLETGTVNGGIELGFPVTAQGRIGRTLSADLGRGGAPIRVRTTNGGLTVRRAPAGT